MPIRKTPTNSNYQTAALSALSARTIFSAASNTTGIKIISGFCAEATNGMGHFVIATSAPSTMTDGVIVSNAISSTPATTDRWIHNIKDDIFVPSGYGLYYINSLLSAFTTTDVSWAPA